MHVKHSSSCVTEPAADVSFRLYDACTFTFAPSILNVCLFTGFSPELSMIVAKKLFLHVFGILMRLGSRVMCNPHLLFLVFLLTHFHSVFETQMKSFLTLH